MWNDIVYFKCENNHGVFVQDHEIMPLSKYTNAVETSEVQNLLLAEPATMSCTITSVADEHVNFTPSPPAPSDTQVKCKFIGNF